MPTVTALHVYPVKSARGLSVGAALVGDRGFEHDRRFMVVDRAGLFVSQRTAPRLALVEVWLDGDTLRIAAPGAGVLPVPLRPVAGPPRTVDVWGDRAQAIALGDEAARYFSAFLGLDCELVYMPDASRRPIHAAYAPASGADRVSFADGFPFLLTTTESLADLASRGAAVPMDRFRPNLVVTGAPPFAEDGWRRIRVGPVVFHVVKPCARCAIITIDQRSGIPVGPEPLATLATYRRGTESDVLFGQNLVHEGRGAISVGDSVDVLE